MARSYPYFKNVEKAKKWKPKRRKRWNWLRERARDFRRMMRRKPTNRVSASEPRGNTSYEYDEYDDYYKSRRRPRVEMFQVGIPVLNLKKPYKT